MKSDFSFGKIIRLKRLGYARAPFGDMRISPHNGQFLIEILPFDLASSDVPDGGKGKEHYCWWEGDVAELIESSPALRQIKQVHKVVRFVMDEAGEVVA